MSALAVSAAGPAAATLHRLQAPPAWRCIEFTSDIHLCADKPRTAEAFFAYLDRTDADAVLLLGDVFEVWVGDDVIDLPGFEADCAARLQQAAQRRTLGFMAGNRDFLVGQRLLAHCGLRALDDPTLIEAWGQRLLLTHGDAWCLSDEPYQAFRAQVRSPAWQQAFLAQPLEERLRLARQMRDASEHRKADQGLAAYPDIDAAHALAWADAAQATTLVHGHTHQPSSGPLGRDSSGRVVTRHVLADWEADLPPHRGDVLRWTADGGLQRRLIHSAPEQKPC
ncbi:MAG: UDP-2,3-diacylglucosamine diphosphatase [Burkholderiales bacterium]